ncbi:MAG: FkbM family methyltransferase, partial [bacterium]
KIENIKLYNPGNIISSTQNKVGDKFEEVETTLLSSYINQKVDFLKMDIEGAETLVFQDLKNNDKLKYINEMIIEYHHTLKENGLSKLLKALEKNNFVYQISSNLKTPFEKNNYQVFLIHAYQKES